MRDSIKALEEFNNMILYGSCTKPDYELEQNKDPPLTEVIQPLTQEQIENLQTNLGIASPSKMMRDSWVDDSSTMERTIEQNKDPPISIDLVPQVVRDEVIKKISTQSVKTLDWKQYLNVPYPPINYVKTLDWNKIIENAHKMVNGKPFETIKPIDYDIFFPQTDLSLRFYDHDPVVFGKVICTNVKSDGSICFTVTPASHGDMLNATVYAFYNGRGNGKTLFMDEISEMESTIGENAANVIERLRDIFSKIEFDKYAQYAVKDPRELKVKLDGSENMKVEGNVIYTNNTQELMEEISSAYTDYSKIYDERNPKIMNESAIKYNEAMDAAKKAYDEAKLAAQREKEQAELAEANEKVASAMKGLYDAYIAQGFTPEQAEKFVTIVLEKVHM